MTLCLLPVKHYVYEKFFNTSEVEDVNNKRYKQYVLLL